MNFNLRPNPRTSTKIKVNQILLIPRLQGYLDALEDAKILIRKDYIEHIKRFSYNDGLKPEKNLLKSK